jgi:hypothetical protein
VPPGKSCNYIELKNEEAVVERKVKTKLPTGEMVDALEVPIEESTDRWSEVRLEDGAIFRVKMNVISVMRVPTMKDQDGNPFYTFNAAPVIALIQPPTKKV